MGEEGEEKKGDLEEGIWVAPVEKKEAKERSAVGGTTAVPPIIARKPVPPAPATATATAAVTATARASVTEDNAPVTAAAVQAVSGQANPKSDSNYPHKHQHHHDSVAIWRERLGRRWAYMALWQKIAATALPMIMLLALVLGLAIGLTVGRAHGGSQNLPLPSNNGGPYTGDLTYYGPGLGACGVRSSSSQDIVAVSHTLFDAAQQSSGSSNPNANPLCGKKIRAKRDKEGVGERSVDLTVVDRCVGCKATDIDVTTSAFEQLADLDLGRVTVTWSWLD